MTAAAPATSLDPRITRFARDAGATMSAEHAAAILNIGRDSVYALCHQGGISAVALSTGKNGKDKPAMQRWSITEAALLRYIIQSTTGDRSIVLQAIGEECARWHRRAVQWAAETPALPSQATATPATTAARKQRSGHDPFAGHPDFFHRITAE
jgi:hypothetical protein